MTYVFKKKRTIILVSLIDALGYFFVWLFRRRKKRRTHKEPGNILIIRMDHLGDVLLATSVPKAVKENFPKSRVTFLTSSWAAPLLENNPFVDEVLIYDAPWFLKKRYKKALKSLSFFGLVRALRRRGINTAIGLRGDFRENLIMALAGIKERVGYGITGGGFFLTRETIYRRLAHESERVEELLKGIGIIARSLVPRIYFSDAEELALDSKLQSFGLAKGEKIIGFQANAGTSAKEWPAEHTDIFLKLVSEHFPDYKILLVGAAPSVLSFPRKRESDLIPAFAGMTEGVGRASHMIDLRGKTSLRDLFLLVRCLNVFVGFDSGPTHIAAALGIPTIFLYSGTNAFEQWKPLFESARVLRHPVPCSPCGLEVCNVKGHPCMSEIKPGEVLKALELYL